MIRSSLSPLALLALFSACAANPPKGGPEAPAADAARSQTDNQRPSFLSSYQLVWADEFNGTKLDRSKWDYSRLGKRRAAINRREAISLDGKGHLIITAKLLSNGSIETGIIGTRDHFQTTYGYWECRARLQETLGCWSGFWLSSKSVGAILDDPGACGAEIDIFECFRPDPPRIGHTIHWNGYKEHHRQLTAGNYDAPELADGFHTFGLLWTADEYVFYVDGRERWRTSQAVSHVPQHAILSLEVNPRHAKYARSIPGFNDHFAVDYVRVYQPLH
jgi:beta-glucanase (GH16 family)